MGFVLKTGRDLFWFVVLARLGPISGTSGGSFFGTSHSKSSQKKLLDIRSCRRELRSCNLGGEHPPVTVQASQVLIFLTVSRFVQHKLSGPQVFPPSGSVN